MSDQSQTEVGSGFDGDELKILKRRATMMGITFSNNIGVEALRGKINAKMEGGSENSDNEENQQVPALNPLEDPRESTAENPVPLPLANTNFAADPSLKETQYLNPSQRKNAFRKALQDKHLKLIRLRIQNLDPKKKDLHGEIFTVANEVLGVVSKFVPYGEVTDGGYHLPYCLYRMLDSRRFVNITVTRDRRTGKESVKTNMAKEFALEVLPQLTPRELQQLAAAQIAAGSVGTE